MGEMSKELKPCPFCGETRLTKEDNQMVRDVHVLCNDCGAKTSFDGIRYAVASRWNCRPVEHALQRHIKALEAENKRMREALKEIAEFAGENFEKRILSPSCVTFETIKLWAEKALKGVNHGQQKI